MQPFGRLLHRTHLALQLVVVELRLRDARVVLGGRDARLDQVAVAFGGQRVRDVEALTGSRLPRSSRLTLPATGETVSTFSWLPVAHQTLMLVTRTCTSRGEGRLNTSTFRSGRSSAAWAADAVLMATTSAHMVAATVLLDAAERMAAVSEKRRMGAGFLNDG